MVTEDLMTRIRHNYIIFGAVIVLFVVLAGGLPKPPEMLQAESGVLDISGIDFAKEGNFRLDGDWEFYWDRLVSYEELREQEPDLYVNIPATWRDYTLYGEDLPGQGYATYRLHVKTDLDPGTKLGIRANTCSSAYNLFVNETLISSNGRVGTSPAEEIGEYKPHAVFFEIPASEFDLLVHVSNYEFATGGIWCSMTIGNEENIYDYNSYMMGKELFLIGILVFISLFHLGIYLLKIEMRSYLCSSFVCILIAVMLDTVGENLISWAIPGVSLSTVIFWWYTADNWVPLLLVCLMHHRFPLKYSGWIVRFCFVCTGAFQIYMLLVPAVQFSQYGLESDALNAVQYLLAVLIVVFGIRKKYKDGWINLFSMLVVLFCYAHDVLYIDNIINDSFGETLYVALFLFLLAETMVQINEMKRFFDRNAATELAFLQAQIKPHFLYNAINTFVSLSRYDIEKARELMLSFSEYLRGSFDFKDLSELVSLREEIRLSQFYVNIEKARFEERLEVVFTIDADQETRVPNLMLEPIIENAINHGVLPKPEGGRVEVTVREESGRLLFSVRDNGVGMGSEQLAGILDRELTEGVGLYNINSRLRRLYGRGLSIDSKPGTGTEVTWTVPRKRKAKLKAREVQ